jgi:hypothetical protein
MQDKSTALTSNVRLNRAALRPLRRACYARLELDLDGLNEALESASRTRSRDTWAAFTRLARIGGLLDRAGWTEQESSERITLDSKTDVALARALLQDELEAESADKATALDEGSEREAAQAARRELEVYDALTGLEAIAATAGMLDAEQRSNRQRASAT